MPMTGRLLDDTKYLLNLAEREIGPAEIARRSGVSFHWLKKFRQGKIQDPGVQVVQQLHDFLKLYREAKGKPPIALDERPTVLREPSATPTAPTNS